MKLRRILSSIIIICISLSMLSACNDSEDESSRWENEEEDAVFATETKTATLVELASTGEIPYDYFCLGMWDYNLFNSYAYGNYADYFETELFPYYYNDKFGFADAEGNRVISERYDQVNFFSENKAFVKEGDNWKVIDTTGKELLTVPSEYNCNNIFFQNGKAIIPAFIPVDLGASLDTSLTYLIIYDNLQTQVIRKAACYNDSNSDVKVFNMPDFSGVLYFRTEYNSKYNHIYTLYDLSGNEIWSVSIAMPARYVEEIDTISGALFDSLGDKGQFVLEGIRPIDTFVAKNGYMNVVNENEKWGLLDLSTGQLAIPCNYDFVGPCSEGLVPVCSYGKWGYLDVNGNTVIEQTFTYTGEFCGNRAFALAEDGSPVVINKNGKVVSTYDITWASDMNQVFPYSEETGISVIVHGDKFGLSYENFSVITTTGNTLLSMNGCKGFYISNKYLFIDGCMYEIRV